jgi:hypothetical protein
VADTAAHTCDRCGDRITVRQGEHARCGCGHTALRWDRHAGCLGAIRTHHPTRPYRNRVRP